MRVFAVFLIAASLPAADWSRFRGPNATGVSDATRLPVEFGPDSHVVWKTPLPRGHSSPVIAGDRIVLTAAEGGSLADAGLKKIVDQGGHLYTVCLDRKTGKILWKQEAPRPRLERYQPTNSPASPTPALEGNNIYVFFGDFGLISYRLDGTERWRFPMGPFNNVNGHGSSPIVSGKLVILLCDQDTNSYLLALDKDTGKVAWKVERPEATRSYTTPAILKPAGGPPELIIPGPYQLTSYNAETGEKLWWIRGLSWQPKSTPVIAGDMIFAHWWENGGESETIAETPAWADMLAKFDANHDGKLSPAEVASDARLTSGFENTDMDHGGFIDDRDWAFYTARRSSRNKLIAVRHGGRGDLTGGKNVLWSMQKFLPNASAPLLYQDVLFIVKDGGIVTSINPKTGEILKQGRIPGALDPYFSSPVGGAGKVYVMSQTGKAVVLSATAQWEVLAVNDLDDECFATPAIADNRIYIRTRSWLYCFEP